MFSLYQESQDKCHRFVLGRPGKRMVFVMGLNPSTATANKPDTTISKVIGVAARNGFDGFAMLNLYPLRATDARTLPTSADNEAMRLNLEAIAATVAATPDVLPKIWAAWGGDIFSRPYLAASLKALITEPRLRKVTWVHHGALTQCGHPRHPSRLNYAWELHPFDVQSYAAQLP